MWRWHVGPLPLTSKWCLKASWQGSATQDAGGLGAVSTKTSWLLSQLLKLIYIFFSLHVIKSCIFRIWLSTSEQQGIVHHIFSRKVNWYILTSFWRIRGEVHIKLCLFYNRNPDPHHKAENTPCISCSFSSGSYLRKSFCLHHCVEEFSVSVQSR